jgi:hypothetical protein
LPRNKKSFVIPVLKKFPWFNKYQKLVVNIPPDRTHTNLEPFGDGINEAAAPPLFSLFSYMRDSDFT